MTQDLRIRLIAAGSVLAVGLATALISAEFGQVRLGAGDMKIELGKSHKGYTMDIAARSCPPYCGVDFNWQPFTR